MSVNSQICTCPSDQQIANLLAGELPMAEVSPWCCTLPSASACRDSIRSAGFSVGSLQAMHADVDPRPPRTIVRRVRPREPASPRQRSRRESVGQYRGLPGVRGPSNPRSSASSRRAGPARRLPHLARIGRKGHGGRFRGRGSYLATTRGHQKCCAKETSTTRSASDFCKRPSSPPRYRAIAS